jgi:PEP-CTERM motif-containing protein
LDGQLFIDVAPNIQPGRYPIMEWGGQLLNHELQIASAPAGLSFEIVVQPNQGGEGGGLTLASDDEHRGGTVYLVVVPEPSICAMMAIGVVGLMRRRRR